MVSHPSLPQTNPSSKGIIFELSIEFFFSKCNDYNMVVDLVQCSPHAVTGFIGLALLTIQTVLPTLFKVKKKRKLCAGVYDLNGFVLGSRNCLKKNNVQDKPELRGVHGILGSGIMALFLVHAAFGLQLGLSY